MPGGYGGGDIVPIMAEPGEVVVPKEVVRSVGTGFFDDLRARFLGVRSSVPVPRIGPVGMAGGGVVPTTGRGGQTELPTLVADEPTLDRLLKGGGGAFSAALGRHKEVLRQLVGGGAGGSLG